MYAGPVRLKAMARAEGEHGGGSERVWQLKIGSTWLRPRNGRVERSSRVRRALCFRQWLIHYSHLALVPDVLLVDHHHLLTVHDARDVSWACLESFSPFSYSGNRGSGQFLSHSGLYWSNHTSSPEFRDIPFLGSGSFPSFARP